MAPSKRDRKASYTERAQLPAHERMPNDHPSSTPLNSLERTTNGSADELLKSANQELADLRRQLLLRGSEQISQISLSNSFRSFQAR